MIRRGKTIGYSGDPTKMVAVGELPIARLTKGADLLDVKAAIDAIGKLSADGLAFLSHLADGTISIRALVIDGIGGQVSAPADGALDVGTDAHVGGDATIDGGVSIGGDAGVGGTLSIGGRVQARMIAAALINGGTSLAGSVGLDAGTPFTHSGTGSYSLKLAAAVANAAKLVVHVTLSTIRGFTEGIAIDTQHIAVATYTTADAAVDTTCSVTIWEVL
jgi:hypothetical protein